MAMRTTTLILNFTMTLLEMLICAFHGGFPANIAPRLRVQRSLDRPWGGDARRRRAARPAGADSPEHDEPARPHRRIDRHREDAHCTTSRGRTLAGRGSDLPGRRERRHVGNGPS